jgi:lysophospholipase L1-like esterase
MIHKANLLLILFGFGLALAIGLITLRLSGRVVVLAGCQPASGDWSQMVYSLMRDYVRPPCTQFELSSTFGEFENLVQLNNYGLNDTIISLEKPAGVFRVLVVGDSFAQGWHVPLEQGFPFLMEQQLARESGSPVEVINLSIDAYGTDRELLLYSVLGWRFQPDLVLLAIYVGNDVQDNEIDLETRRYGYRLDHPFFTLEDGALSLHHSPVFSPARYETSAAYRWLTRLQAQQDFLPPENPPLNPQVLSESPYILEYPVELGVYLPEDEHWANAWALTEALVVQMRDLAQAEGSRFAAVLIPDRRAVHSEDWGLTLQDYPILQGADPVAPVTRMEELLAWHEIATLNLTWYLRAWQFRNIGERLYYEEDGHFNAIGHAVTAERIADWLQAEGLAP